MTSMTVSPTSVLDRVCHQLAGEQFGITRLDWDIPGVDVRTDLATGFSRCQRSSWECDAARALQGRADRGDRIHLVSLPGRVGPVVGGAQVSLRGQSLADPVKF